LNLMKQRSSMWLFQCGKRIGNPLATLSALMKRYAYPRAWNASAESKPFAREELRGAVPGAVKLCPLRLWSKSANLLVRNRPYAMRSAGPRPNCGGKRRQRIPRSRVKSRRADLPPSRRRPGTVSRTLAIEGSPKTSTDSRGLTNARNAGSLSRNRPNTCPEAGAEYGFALIQGAYNQSYKSLFIAASRFSMRCYRDFKPLTPNGGNFPALVSIFLLRIACSRFSKTESSVPKPFCRTNRAALPISYTSGRRYKTSVIQTNLIQNSLPLRAGFI